MKERLIFLGWPLLAPGAETHDICKFRTGLFQERFRCDCLLIRSSVFARAGHVLRPQPSDSPPTLVLVPLKPYSPLPHTPGDLAPISGSKQPASVLNPMRKTRHAGYSVTCVCVYQIFVRCFVRSFVCRRRALCGPALRASGNGGV